MKTPDQGGRAAADQREHPGGAGQYGNDQRVGAGMVDELDGGPGVEGIGGKKPQRHRKPGGQGRQEHGDREADAQREGGTPSQLPFALGQRNGQGCERPELRPDGHGPDNGDGRIRDDADGSQLGSQDKERQVAPREARILARLAGHLVPDHGVGPVAGCCGFGVVGTPGEHQLRHGDGNGTQLLNPQDMQLFEQLLHRFPGDVDHHHIAGRLDGRTFVDGHFRRPGLLRAAFHHKVRELRGYADAHLNDHVGHSSVFAGFTVRPRTSLVSGPGRRPEHSSGNSQLAVT